MKKFSGDKLDEIIKLIEKFKLDEGEENILERKKGQIGGAR